MTTKAFWIVMAVNDPVQYLLIGHRLNLTSKNSIVVDRIVSGYLIMFVDELHFSISVSVS